MVHSVPPLKRGCSLRRHVSGLHISLDQLRDETTPQITPVTSSQSSIFFVFVTVVDCWIILYVAILIGLVLCCRVRLHGCSHATFSTRHPSPTSRAIFPQSTTATCCRKSEATKQKRRLRATSHCIKTKMKQREPRVFRPHKIAE